MSSSPAAEEPASAPGRARGVLTKPIDSVIAVLREQGWPVLKIARHLSVHRSVVWGALARLRTAAERLAAEPAPLTPKQAKIVWRHLVNHPDPDPEKQEQAEAWMLERYPDCTLPLKSRRKATSPEPASDSPLAFGPSEATGRP